jgi:hypothetical protein
LNRPQGPRGAHLDDDLLTLIRAGGAGPPVLGYVRDHIVGCPPCRRLVSAALADDDEPGPGAGDPGWGTVFADGGRASPGGADAGHAPRVVVPTAAADAPARHPRATWPKLAAAAAVLVGAGLLYVQFGRHPVRDESAPTVAVVPRPTPPPVSGGGFTELASAFEVRSAGRMAAEGGLQAPERLPSGEYAVRPGETLQILVDPPRNGLAVVVQAGPDRWKVLQGELPVSANVKRTGDDDPTNVYTPIPAPERPATFLVVLTDRAATPARETVTSTVTPDLKGPGDIPKWKPTVLDALRRDGHGWGSVGEIPTRPGETR